MSVEYRDFFTPAAFDALVKGGPGQNIAVEN